MCMDLLVVQPHVCLPVDRAEMEYMTTTYIPNRKE